MLLSLTDSPSWTGIALLCGVIGIVVDRVMDARGWSRSSKTLRRENIDLLRRNVELETTVTRLTNESAELKREVARLAAEVTVLAHADQRAVLAQLKLHEEKAEERSTKTTDLLVEIRDALQAK